MNPVKIIAFMLQQMVLFGIVHCDWMDHIKDQVLNNLNPYQVVTFISNTTIIKNSSQEMPIIHDHPNMVLPFENTNLMPGKSNQWDSLSRKRLMQNSLIILHTNNPDEIESFFDFLQHWLLNTRVRPKCLTIGAFQLLHYNRGETER